MLSARRPTVVVCREWLLPGQRGGHQPPGYRVGSSRP